MQAADDNGQRTLPAQHHDHEPVSAAAAARSRLAAVDAGALSPGAEAPLPPVSRRRAVTGSLILLALVGGIAAGLATWKHRAIQAAAAAAAQQPEPAETVRVGVAAERRYARTTTSIGTVVALRSIVLRNELPGTVRHVALAPGQVVDAGTLLVALDVTVEEAELQAQQAQAALAETLLQRMERASEGRGASAAEVDRARADRDVALAQIARTKAVIARKTIVAPFRARIGMADVHPGQYLDAGAELTTLQGVDDGVHVDFSAAQRVAAGLRAGMTVDVVAGDDAAPRPAAIVAVDARIDRLTRNAAVRAKITGGDDVPAPGSSVRVLVPTGPATMVTTVPVTALRKGPAGDHVFVITTDERGSQRARLRPVRSGALLGDEIVILEGLQAGEKVATTGSFKLQDAMLIALASDTGTGAQR